jgi:tRNA(Ile)-lysidine synthase TilS/MesJ
MVTEQERLFKRLNERFVRAFATYKLLQDDDRVLVGLSGGKDSLLLTELLAKRARIAHPRFHVEAVHVRMENVSYETSTDYLEQFCKELDVPLHIVTTSFDSSQPKDSSLRTGEGDSSLLTLHSSLKQKPPCFLCSWHRRKQLFNLAQELGCNKIALGHHQDDLLHTCLMNLFYQGRFDTMPALLKMRKMPLSIIRPLCMVEEADIQHYAELRGYEKQVKLCPYEHDSHRSDMRQLFETLQQQNGEMRHSLWNAIVRADKLVQLS